MLPDMAPTRKVTVHLPDELLERAQRSTGKGLTDTIREGLKQSEAPEEGRCVIALDTSAVTTRRPCRSSRAIGTSATSPKALA